MWLSCDSARDSRWLWGTRAESPVRAAVSRSRVAAQRFGAWCRARVSVDYVSSEAGQRCATRATRRPSSFGVMFPQQASGVINPRKSAVTVSIISESQVRRVFGECSLGSAQAKWRPRPLRVAARRRGMLAVTVAVLAAVPRPYGQPWRGARMTAQFPKLVAPEVEPMCDASRSQLCTYSVLDGMCHPQNICRPASCGMLMCACKPLSVNALPPWQVLELNFSAALDPIAVRQAFHARARVLAPERNPACLARAPHYIGAHHLHHTSTACLPLIRTVLYSVECRREPAPLAPLTLSRLARANPGTAQSGACTPYSSPHPPPRPIRN